MSEAKSTRHIVLGLPSDQRVLAAIGKISIRHGQLDLCMKMLIRSLAGITREEAEAALERETSSSLRDRARKLARKRIGESPELLRLQALLSRAKKATEGRNQLLHALWAEELDVGTVYQKPGQTFETSPSVDQLEAVSSELETIARELNQARLDGFLTEILRRDREE